MATKSKNKTGPARKPKKQVQPLKTEAVYNQPEDQEQESLNNTKQPLEQISSSEIAEQQPDEEKRPESKTESNAQQPTVENNSENQLPAPETQPQKEPNNGGKMKDFEDKEKQPKKPEAGGGSAPEPSQAEKPEGKKNFQPAGGSGYNPLTEDKRPATEVGGATGKGSTDSEQAKLEEEWKNKNFRQKMAALRAQVKENGKNNNEKRNLLPDSVLNPEAPKSAGAVIRKRLPKLFAPQVFIATMLRILAFFAGDQMIIPMIDAFLGEDMTDNVLLGALGCWCCINCCAPVVIIIIIIGTMSALGKSIADIF